jgi:hypothetical protein
MPDYFQPSRPDPAPFSQHVAALQRRLDESRWPSVPEALAERTGTSLLIGNNQSGQFRLKLWDQAVCLEYPGFNSFDQATHQELPVPSQAVLLYYFITADGAPQESRWVSFGELPDGRFYNQAFQGYSGAELARTFQNDLLAFDYAAARSGGIQAQPGAEIPGDRAYLFRALPRLSLLVVYWQGDEDFPASAQILFERSVSHYLPTDVCAYLGSSLTRRLIKNKP